MVIVMGVVDRPGLEGNEMLFGKKRVVLLLGVFLIFALASCARYESPPMETEILANGSILDEINGEEEMSDEKALDEERTPKEYASYIEPYLAEIYLEVLSEKREEIISPAIGIPNDTDSDIAILDVFGDETPELLYIYQYDWLEEDEFLGDFIIPCFALKILSYSESAGIESIFEAPIFIAADAGNSYCVYLTHEGELIIYHSNFGFPYSWGFWQVKSNQNLEITDEYWVGNYSSDLARLYYARFYDEGETILYKKNGEKLSKEQYDIAAREIMGDIDHVIFQFFELYGSDRDDDLWNSIMPFEAECMTYTETITWLEASIEMGKQ